MQMMFFCLILLTIQISASDSLPNNFEESIFYDDTYYLKEIQAKKLKEELNRENLRQSKKIMNIKNLDTYIAKNKEKFKNMGIINEIEQGTCMKIVDFASLFRESKNENYIQTSNFLESLQYNLNEKNFLFSDEFGNLIIYSACGDLFSLKCYAKVFFVSKIDFQFYEFTHSGEKIPKLSGFAVDFYLDQGANRKIIYLYGGIDSKGEHNKDLFRMEIDYTFGNVKMIKSGIKEINSVPSGYSEPSLNVLTYSKEDSFSESASRHLILTYGGINDQTISNKMHVYNPDNHIWSDVLTLEQRKGHSTILITPEDDNISFDDNNYNKDLMKTYYLLIFGGKSESIYHNDLMIVQISYMTLDDTFFYKLLPKMSTTGDVPLPREGHRAVKRGNYMYIFGGCNYQFKKCFDKEVFRLDLSSQPPKWEKINIDFGNKQHLDQYNLNAINFWGQFINFGYGNSNIAPMLLVNDINCKCDTIRLIGSKFSDNLTLSCNNNDIYLINKDTVNKKTDGKMYKNATETLKMAMNFTSFNQTGNKIPSNNTNNSSTVEISPNLNQSNKNLNKRKSESLSPILNLTQSLNNNTTSLRKCKNQTHHKMTIKDKIHSFKAKRHPKHHKKQHEMKKIMNEALEEIKMNMKPLLRENEILKKAFRIQNRTHYDFSFTQLGERKAILRDNFNLMKNLSMNISDIKSYMSNLNNKTNDEIKLYLKSLVKKFEEVNNKTKKKFEELEELKKNQEKFNKIIKANEKVKCVNGYIKNTSNKTECHCFPGYTGPTCEIQLECRNQCNQNGICQYGKCFCNPGFTGETCEIRQSCLNDCYNRGSCVYGKCFCDAGFSGVDCGIKLQCENNCSNRGICFREKCLCEPGYTGKDCSILSIDFNPCKDNCNGNGICKLEKCFCYPGFSGTFCEVKNEFTCPPFINADNLVLSSNNTKANSKNISALNSTTTSALISWTPCNGNGICKYGMCFCYPGFKGEDCSVVVKEENNLRPPKSKTTSNNNPGKKNKIDTFRNMKFREVESNFNSTVLPTNDSDPNAKKIYIGIFIISALSLILLTVVLNKKFEKLETISSNN